MRAWYVGIRSWSGDGRGGRMLITLALIGCITVSAVLTGYDTDSPWMASAVQHYLTNGEFRLLGFRHPVLFGDVLFYADSLAYRFWPDYLAIRWVQMLAAFLAFPLCLMLLQTLDTGVRGKHALILTVFCLVMLASPGLLDGRPEALLVFCQLAVLCSLARFCQDRQGWHLLPAGLCIALGSVIHPNGALPSLYVIVALVLGSRHGVGRLIPWLVISLVGGLLVLWGGLVWGRGLAAFISAFREVSGDTGHGLAPYQEYLRYLAYFRRAPLHFWVLAGGMVCLFWPLRGASDPGAREALNFLRGSAVATLVFLVFMPAKWEHYIAAFYVFSLIGLCRVLLRQEEAVRRGLAVAMVALIGSVWAQEAITNDAAHRLLNLSTGRGQILASMQERVRGSKVLGPVKLYFYVSKETDFHITEKTAPDDIKKMADLQWLIVESLVDSRQLAAVTGRCLDHEMSLLFNRTYYNLYRVTSCPAT